MTVTDPDSISDYPLTEMDLEEERLSSLAITEVFEYVNQNVSIANVAGKLLRLKDNPEKWRTMYYFWLMIKITLFKDNFLKTEENRSKFLNALLKDVKEACELVNGDWSKYGD